jgi:Ca2+-binding EF-hand superfamily protein
MPEGSEAVAKESDGVEPVAPVPVTPTEPSPRPPDGSAPSESTPRKKSFVEKQDAASAENADAEAVKEAKKEGEQSETVDEGKLEAPAADAADDKDKKEEVPKEEKDNAPADDKDKKEDEKKEEPPPAETDKTVDEKKEEVPAADAADDKDTVDAATKIQSIARGKADRKKVEAMAVPEAASDKERIDNLFARFDLDSSGDIDLAELKEFVGDEGVAITIMEQLDTLQKDGKVVPDEFAEYFKRIGESGLVLDSVTIHGKDAVETMLKEMEDIAFIRATPAEAALKIQSITRGKADRKKVEEIKKDGAPGEAKEDEKKEEAPAAAKAAAEATPAEATPAEAPVPGGTRTQTNQQPRKLKLKGNARRTIVQTKGNLSAGSSWSADQANLEAMNQRWGAKNATPAEATPVEATPAEATPAEATPAEATPVEATPAAVEQDPFAVEDAGTGDESAAPPAAAAAVSEVPPPSRTTQLFGKFDLNASGEIDVEELKGFVGDDNVAKAIIDQLDTLNKDGKVTLDEFEEYFKRLGEKGLVMGGKKIVGDEAKDVMLSEMESLASTRSAQEDAATKIQAKSRGNADRKKPVETNGDTGSTTPGQ